MQALHFTSLIVVLFSCFACALDNITFANFAHSATFSVAQELGFFTHYNLNVIYAQIPNSTFAFEQLANGGYDVAGAQIDNAVNLVLNSNESFTVIGQVDAGPELSFASIPSITSVSELKGKPIIVDSPTSGYAYVIQKVLSYYGLRLDQGDYTFQPVGGSQTRFDDLIASTQANPSTPIFATILPYPFISEILSLPTPQQPTILFKISDFILPYSSTALTVSTPTLSSSTLLPKLTRLYAALLSANKFLANPSPSAQNLSIAAIAKVLNVTNAVATSAYEAATAPLTGETSTSGGNFTVDRIGLVNVIDVRDQFGGFEALRARDPGFSFVEFLVPRTGGFIDYGVQREAVGLLDGWVPDGFGRDG